MTLAVGTKLDPYEILSPLGAGGMGEVWLAEDICLNRKVALKLLPEQFTRDEDRVRRFGQEAKAASALNHPNIITIFEIGEVEGALATYTESGGQGSQEATKTILAQAELLSEMWALAEGCAYSNRSALNDINSPSSAV